MKKKMDRVQFGLNFLGFGMSFIALILYFIVEHINWLHYFLLSEEADGMSFLQMVGKNIGMFLISIVLNLPGIIFYLVMVIIWIYLCRRFRKSRNGKIIFSSVLLFGAGIYSFGAFAVLLIVFPSWFLFYNSRIPFLVAGIVQVICAVAKLICYIIERKTKIADSTQDM